MCSDFRDLFDVERFVQELSKDVRVVKEAPRDVASSPFSMRVPRWSKPSYYKSTVHRALREKQVRFAFQADIFRQSVLLKADHNMRITMSLSGVTS